VILPALLDFPSDDIEKDSARINKAIEDMVYANPGQYGWVHKRFKHRPPGEQPLY
jgi:KDO2-lipid IV(A) lauroyltransferase